MRSRLEQEELDRREFAINQLTTDLQTTQTTLSTVQTELTSLSQENSSLDAQLNQLRLETQHKNEQESSDVVSLTRELRELRGDMERIRMEREEWEEEAGREREKRERLEEERRGMERRLMDAEERRSGAEDGWRREEKRASNLEEVLGEFQAGEFTGSGGSLLGRKSASLC
jgi:chromosome segregation ATPase